MKDPHESSLRAQDRFDHLRASLGPAPVVDLAYANAWDGPSEEFEDALHAAIDRGGALGLQYTPYGGTRIARRVVADDLGPSLGGEITWREVTLTPGAMAGLHLVLRSLAGTTSMTPNIIIPTPCWLDHPLYAEDLGYEVRLIPREAGTLALDLRSIAEAIDEDTVGLVLAQPCNPTGRVHDEAVLRALSDQLAQRWWISDECHRDYARIQSPAKFHANTATVYSYGKRWGAQGQRMGAVVTRDAELNDALARNLRVGGYGMPTTLMQRAMPDLVRVRPATGRLARRRERVIDALADAYEFAPSNGTFFLYLRVEDEWEFAERLAARRVLVLPAALFHHHGYVRISLSADDAMIDRAIAVLLEEAP